ncbi:MAG: hypothetical protein R3286_00840 [Gammaproteobacteria bacterium]|nr:hypothetical protein [Gammaproteobacteria bacterium]
MKRVFGILSVAFVLSACTAAEKQELEASNKMEEKAQYFCAITKGYANDPKTLVSCKEHYMQGMMDAQKTN